MRIALRLLAAVLMLAPMPALAQISCDYTFSSFARSSYLRNLDIVTRQPVIQSDLYVVCNDGWGFDLWKSVSLSRGLNSDAAEVDYTVFKLGKIPSLGISYDVGVSYYDLNRTFRFQSGDLIVPYLELTLDDGFKISGGPKIVPFARLEMYHGLGGKYARHAFVPFLGIDHFWRLDEGVLLSNRTAFLQNPNALGARPGQSFVHETKLKFDVTIWDAKLTLILPNIKFAAPVRRENGIRTKINIHPP